MPERKHVVSIAAGLDIEPAYHDVVVASTDLNGTQGELARLVSDALELSDAQIPGADELEQGYAVKPDLSPLVLYVVASDDDAGAHGLVNQNLKAGLAEVATVVNLRPGHVFTHVWLPLMGTTSGVSPHESLETTCLALKALGAAWEGMPLAVDLSLPVDVTPIPAETVRLDQALEVAASLLGDGFEVRPKPRTGPTAAPRVAHWILRGSARTKELAEAFRPGETATWPLTTPLPPVALGDRVFAWISWRGQPVRCIAYAEVSALSSAGAEGNGESHDAVDLRCLSALEPVIGQTDLTSMTEFVETPFVWADDAGSFRLTDGQRDSLYAFAHSRMNPAPPPIRERVDTKASFHNDAPTTEDDLGHDAIAYSLAAFLKDRGTGLPLTVAIDGSWGSGKSSIMKMLREHLQPGIHEAEREASSRFGAEGTLSALRTVARILRAQVVGGLGVMLERIRRRTSPAERSPAAPEANAGTDPEGLASSEEHPGTGRRFETVYFNAWRYGTGSRLTASMVHRILQSLTARRGASFLYGLGLRRVNAPALAGLVARSILGNVLVLAALASMTFALAYFAVAGGDEPAKVAASGGLGTVAFLFVYGAFQRLMKTPPRLDFSSFVEAPDYEGLMGPEHEIEQDFARLLGVLESEGKSLALFIDDLDRCSPPVLSDVIEGLNVFFGRSAHSNCVFVLGMHLDLVAANLELAFSGLADAVARNEALKDQRPFGRRFLEKVAQFVVHLPEPSAKDVEQYVRRLVGWAPEHEDSAEERDRDEEARAEQVSRTAFSLIREEAEVEASMAGGAAAVDVEDRTSSVARRKRELGVSDEVYWRARDLYEAREARLAEARAFNERSDGVREVFEYVRFALGNNPRQYKRFFNILRFENFLAANRGDERTGTAVQQLLPVAIQTALILEHPDIAAWVNRNEGGLARITEDARRIRDGIDLEAPPQDDSGLLAIRKTLSADAELRVLLLRQLEEGTNPRPGG